MIDDLLDFVEVRVTIITLDAIGAHKTITERINGGGGNYVFAIKDNHPTLADVINRARQSVWKQQQEEGFLERVTIKADGTMAETTGEKR